MADTDALLNEEILTKLIENIFEEYFEKQEHNITKILSVIFRSPWRRLDSHKIK